VPNGVSGCVVGLFFFIVKIRHYTKCHSYILTFLRLETRNDGKNLPRHREAFPCIFAGKAAAIPRLLAVILV
jgi:hypothetical protein